MRSTTAIKKGKKHLNGGKHSSQSECPAPTSNTSPSSMFHTMASSDDDAAVHCCGTREEIRGVHQCRSTAAIGAAWDGPREPQEPGERMLLTI